MIAYKGYTGVFDVDLEAGLVRGKVVGLKDVVTFQGATVADAVTAFHESVDDYLAFCESLGEAPERPYSGKFLIRVAPSVHRDLTVMAESKGVSVNRLVTHKLTKLVNSSSALSFGGGKARPAVAAKAKPKTTGKAVVPTKPKQTKAKVK